MLVVKVEIWPHGLSDGAFEIARLGVDNRSPGKRVADYGVTALMGRDTDEEFAVRGQVLGHVRKDGWMPLVSRAVYAAQCAVPQPHHLDTAIADLLRSTPHVHRHA